MWVGTAQNCISTYNCLGFNDNSGVSGCEKQSIVTIPVTGQFYQVVVGGYFGYSGAYTLTWNHTRPRPSPSLTGSVTPSKSKTPNATPSLSPTKTATPIPSVAKPSNRFSESE